MRLSPSPAWRDLTCSGKLVELDRLVLELLVSWAPLNTSLAVSPSTHLSRDPEEASFVIPAVKIIWTDAPHIN